jgi:hypothetical protein
MYEIFIKIQLMKNCSFQQPVIPGTETSSPRSSQWSGDTQRSYRYVKGIFNIEIKKNNSPLCNLC